MTRHPACFRLAAQDTILDYPEYCFEMDTYENEEGQQVLFAHIFFRKFSPSIFKRVLKEWQAFRFAVSGPIYAIRNDGPEDKWKHFVTRLGFKPTGILVPTNSGAIRELYLNTVDYGQLEIDTKSKLN